MAHISYRTVINEGRTFAVIELGFPYKQVDRQPFLLMLDKVAAFFIGRRGGILALSMEGAVEIAPDNVMSEFVYRTDESPPFSRQAESVAGGPSQAGINDP